MRKSLLGGGVRARPGANVGPSRAKPRTPIDPKPAATTIGLAAFEKISAVEGISLDERMREDLEYLESSGMNELERSRFVLERYGHQ